MRRLLPLLLLALIAAGCGTAPVEDGVPLEATKAPPRSAKLHWREAYGLKAERLVFAVERLEVRSDGWEAEVSVANDTKSAFEVSPPAERTFGLMVFGTGDQAELDRLNASGELPALRPALEFDPPLPRALVPGETWSGTISAPGALPDGRWVRVVFGVFTVSGEPPAGMQPRVSWITDAAYEL